MNKKESKYFCTAEKMDCALIELLEKKEFEYITVKEICAKAGVNRSTFYLHYENTSDLLKEATRYIVDKFLEYFPKDKNKKGIDFENCKLEELVFIREEYVMPYLAYIKDNQRLFKTAIKQFGTMGLEVYYNRMFKYIFSPVLERFDVPDAERQYVMKFYLMGVTAISMEWLKNGCDIPMDKMCEIIVKCILREGEYEN